MTATLPSAATALLPTSIPSPDQSVWHVGPVPIRGYALAIIVGIIVAIWLGGRRWVARGGAAGAVADIAIWAVPFGIVGARIYHVITDYQLYFGEGREPWRIFEIWEGGIGIWGAIAGGALGAWIGCRRRGIPLPAMADALAPGILLAQAIGRWGNWFNQELFGGPTDLPWGLEISPENRPLGYADAETFHPTFLYESLWAVLVALLLIWADRRFILGHGRVFALYVAGYTLGRSLFEYLRIDPANEILGLRVNQWVSALLFVAALLYILISARTRPGREEPEKLLGVYATESSQAHDGAGVADTAVDAGDTDSGTSAGASVGSDSSAGARADDTRADVSADDVSADDVPADAATAEEGRADEGERETEAGTTDESRFSP